MSLNVTVIGAGVVGLTTALKAQERGYNVTIVAEYVPGDPKNTHYTSNWAGAHHVSTTGKDLRQQKLDRETFDVMWKMSEPGSDAEHCFLRLPQEEYYDEPIPRPSFLEFMPEFRYVPKAELAHIQGAIEAESFETVTIDVPVYLRYLYQKFTSNGGKVKIAKVQHITQVLQGVFSEPTEASSSAAPDESKGKDGVKSDDSDSFLPSSKRVAPVLPDAVFVCTGIGSRFLGGVEDRDVYPVRGQTVLLRAPWMRYGRSQRAQFMGGQAWTYIIPRKSGDVIVGGTRGDDDWYPYPRPETSLDILTRALALCPDLVPPNLRDSSGNKKPTVDDLKDIIIEEGCGFRPGRKGGIRLETQWMARSAQKGGAVSDASSEETVPVVYNYGHGGYGYQSSWGSASMAVSLLQKALSGAE